LFIAFGGVHGNEPAGVRALELTLEMLDMEPRVNPDFRFRGRFVAFIGNLAALRAGERYLRQDLNRMMSDEALAAARAKGQDFVLAEERELLELMTLIDAEVEAYNPDRIYVLDLHTTSADGGIFSLVSEDEDSLRLATALHAPVIKGMIKGVKGSSLHYFTSERFGIPTSAVVFEAGRHDDPLSVNRSISAIVNCMRTIGCVAPHDVEHRHDRLLIEYSRHLPKVAELVTWHPIHPDDGFKMAPNFQNFQTVREGQVLASDKRGPVVAPADGRLLMPLYQRRGEEGFFIVRPVEEYEERMSMGG
jgi:succinylglutamate desuccinylase